MNIKKEGQCAAKSQCCASINKAMQVQDDEGVLHLFGNLCGYCCWVNGPLCEMLCSMSLCCKVRLCLKCVGNTGRLCKH